jgi:hypothetical protein
MGQESQSPSLIQLLLTQQPRLAVRREVIRRGNTDAITAAMVKTQETKRLNNEKRLAALEASRNRKRKESEAKISHSVQEAKGKTHKATLEKAAKELKKKKEGK